MPREPKTAVWGFTIRESCGARGRLWSDPTSNAQRSQTTEQQLKDNKSCSGCLLGRSNHYYLVQINWNHNATLHHLRHSPLLRFTCSFQTHTPIHHISHITFQISACPVRIVRDCVSCARKQRLRPWRLHPTTPMRLPRGIPRFSSLPAAPGPSRNLPWKPLRLQSASYRHHALV